MTTREDIFDKISPLVHKLDFELEDVILKSAGKNTIVQVLVDKDSGISLDEVANLSTKLSDFFDENSLMGNKTYTLDVGSPGIDRPLTKLRHWKKNLDRLVKINSKSNVFEGRIKKVEELEVQIDIKGKLQSFQYSDISKAIIQVEFNPKKK
jgi:ribosome maturation factor RimP